MLSAKPWRAEFVIQFCAVQFVCLCLGLAAAELLQMAGMSVFKSPDGFGSVLLSTLGFQGVTWILIPIFLRQHQIGWREAFGFRGLKFLSTLLMAVAAMSVILPVALGLEGASAFILGKIGWPVEDQVAVKLVAGAETLWMQVYLGVFTVILAPVAEEFIFRGVLYPFIKQLGRPRLAWFGVSALFAFIHFDAARFVPLFWLALALTWLYEQTDCLLVPIAAHSLFNSVGFIIILFGEQLSHILRELSQRLHL
jgi:membrane protease YdiL (CAAX protease family)